MPEALEIRPHPLDQDLDGPAVPFAASGSSVTVEPVASSRVPGSVADGRSSDGPRVRPWVGVMTATGIIVSPPASSPDNLCGHERERLSSEKRTAAREKRLAISEFPKGRKYLISLSFRGKASVRPAQVGGFDVNIVIHGSTAVRGRGDLVAYRWALWKLTAPWTHRTRPPHLGKRCAFSTSSTGPFPSNHSRKTPKGPKIALGNPDRPKRFGSAGLEPAGSPNQGDGIR